MPSGNVTLSVLLPAWSTPPAVNTPDAMIVLSGDVGDVVMSWKCSVPDRAALAAGRAAAAACAGWWTAGRALAAAKPAPLVIAAVRATPVISVASELVRREVNCMVPPGLEPEDGRRRHPAGRRRRPPPRKPRIRDNRERKPRPGGPPPGNY